MLLFCPIFFAHGQDKERLKDFVELAHHEIEVGEADAPGFKAKLQKALKSLNPKQIFLEAKRWHNIHSVDPEFGDHAKNLAFLLPMTESLEIATGPAMTWLTLNSNYPAWVDGLLLSGGYLVSIPMVIEPYCGTMILLYLSSKKVRGGITRLRLSVVKGAHRFCEITGLKDKWNQLLPQQEVLKELLENKWVKGAEKLFWRSKRGGELQLVINKYSGTDDLY